MRRRRTWDGGCSAATVVGCGGGPCGDSGRQHSTRVNSGRNIRFEKGGTVNVRIAGGKSSRRVVMT